MSTDLTNSRIHRQNILNNAYAIDKIQEVMALEGMAFEGNLYLTKRQVMHLFDVTESTVERYISEHRDELDYNGYVLLRGKSLKNMRLRFGALIDEGTKTTVLGLFSIRAVLNLAMLLVESERARVMRARILDVVIDTIAQRAGGNTKYINQRDPDYLLADFQQVRYRKEFTGALNSHVDWNSTYKYPYYTDKIYKSIFHEDAREYKKVLQLADHENARDTMYSEVLKLIAAYENGLAHELATEAARLGRKLSREEADSLFARFESHPLFKPLVEDCRTKMASRDLHFRDALHQKLASYLTEISATDFEKFLGDKSRALEDHIRETSEVFERLRDR